MHVVMCYSQEWFNDFGKQVYRRRKYFISNISSGAMITHYQNIAQCEYALTQHYYYYPHHH